MEPEPHATVDERELVRRCLPSARLFFIRHGRAFDAEDLAHTALLTTMEALRSGKVRDPQRMGGFVLGVCRNLVRAQARRDARQHLALMRLDPEEVTQPRVPSVDGFRLWQCINGLSARARDVVLRSLVHDEEPQAIADAHGTTLGNVRVLRHRALAALLACLEPGRSP